MYENQIVSTGTTTFRPVEEIRPATDMSLSDALGKLSQLSARAAETAAAFLIARDNWLHARSELDQIQEQVSRFRQEHDVR